MQQNPSNSHQALQHKKAPIQLGLPGIEYAPAEVRAHGLREAHPWPLVSRGKSGGVVLGSFRVHAAEAWGYPSVELRAVKSWPCVVLDCDGETGYSRLMVAVVDREIPCPNWVCHRATGGAHGVWTLARPVLRGAGARERPLKLLARASEYLAQVVGADAGYTGVLTHNPMTPEPGQNLTTEWMRPAAYRLAELAELIPFGWKRPAVPQTGIGRNCCMFEALLKWAGSPGNLGLPVLPAAMAIYREIIEQFPGASSPFTPGEVAGIARSVERYRARWIERGQFGPVGDRERQTWGRARGLKGGAARRKGTPLEVDREPWKAAGMSRATWYRHKRWKQGVFSFGTEAKQLTSLFGRETEAKQLTSLFGRGTELNS